MARKTIIKCVGINNKYINKYTNKTGGRSSKLPYPESMFHIPRTIKSAKVMPAVQDYSLNLSSLIFIRKGKHIDEQ